MNVIARSALCAVVHPGLGWDAVSRVYNTSDIKGDLCLKYRELFLRAILNAIVFHEEQFYK